MDIEFVTVNSNEINNNNIVEKSPYIVTDMDDKAVDIPLVVEKGVPQCDLCFKKFETFSKLYKHKGGLCFTDSDPNSLDLKITFPKTQLYYVGDILKSLEKKNC